MGRINLHMHSNDSLDGSETINSILNECEQANISMASITDHDTCQAYQELEENSYTGKLISGIEADAMIGVKTYDILCYGFDLPEVSSWAEKQYGTLAFRQQKIFNQLKIECEKLNLPLPNIDSYDASKEFAHAGLFRLLQETKEGQEFLQEYKIESVGDLYRAGTMDQHFPLYVDMHVVWPDITEVREIIHRNGGKLFLAHPYRYGKENVTEILDSCTPYIDGIELWNNPETEEQTRYLYQYALEHQLLMSIGSDYHGKTHPKHNSLSIPNFPVEIEKQIVSWTNNCKSLIKK